MPDINGYVSGKEASALVGGVAFPFGEFDLDMSASGMPDLTNWQTAPFSYVVAGIHRATLRLRGPYQYNHMPLTNLNTYAMTLAFFTGVTLTGSFVIAIKITNKVDDAPRIEVTGKPVGTFTVSTV